jgi:tetratricopeptide (TPR) repeat protein
MILGSAALKSGRVDLAIEELERSIKLYLDKDCYLRLAEAYLTLARADNANWKQWIGKARDMWQSASDADVRGRCANDLAAIKAGLDAAEREKKALKTLEE